VDTAPPHCLHNDRVQSQPPMRLRLVHTLSLLLLSAVLLAVVAMAGVTAWSLGHGFADYLAARDIERLELFADLVAEAAIKAGGARALTEGRLSMRELMDEFAQRQGLPPRRGGPTQGSASASGGPPPGGHEGFGPRISVVDLNGQSLMDRPAPNEGVPVIDRPIRVGGHVVALARLAKVARVPDAVEARFLRSQYLSILGVAAALMLLAVVSAWWVARRWVRPLLAVQDATARLARGETDVRLVGPHQGPARSDEIGDLARNVNLMAEGL
jgi:two-component system, OmpR family, sensor histidine kinase BaeS